MAVKNNQLTQATGITADLVLELGRHYSAKQMRSVQTGLTTAASELRSLTHHEGLLGRLGDRLTPEQRELLTNAAKLLDSIKHNVENAKERKDRVEKDLAKKRDMWERQAKQLVGSSFPNANGDRGRPATDSGAVSCCTGCIGSGRIVISIICADRAATPVGPKIASLVLTLVGSVLIGTRPPGVNIHHPAEVVS